MITYQALAAEAEARWQVDPARLAKAVEIAARGHNIFNLHCPVGEWDVRSTISLNGWYHVDTKHHTCTCKDSMTGHVCKHRLAIWLYTECIVRTHAQARQCEPAVIMHQLGYA
jgi:hypothetical protein